MVNDMGKLIKIDGACKDYLFEEANQDLQCNHCPFNAMDNHAGCCMNFPERLFTLIPEYSTKDPRVMKEDEIVQELWSNADHGLELLKIVPRMNAVMLNCEQTKAVFCFLSTWTPEQDDAFLRWYRSIDEYDGDLRVLQMIMRRAVLLGKGIVVDW